MCSPNLPSHHDKESTFPNRKDLLLREVKQAKTEGGLFDYVIRKGQELASPPSLRSNKHLLHGCLYHVWLFVFCRRGRLYILGDSNSKIIKGQIAILVQLLSGMPCLEVSSADLSFIYNEIVFLIPTLSRNNTVKNIEEIIKAKASQTRIKRL